MLDKLEMDFSKVELSSAYTPIYQAARMGDVDALRMLLSEEEDHDLEKGEYCGPSPLMTALRFMHYDCAKLLVEAGANVDKMVHEGVEKGNISILKFMNTLNKEQLQQVSSPPQQFA